VALLPQLLLQCSQFATLPGAAQDAIVADATPPTFSLPGRLGSGICCTVMSQLIFCPIKRFLEIYANACNQRNRTEAAVDFVQQKYCCNWGLTLKQSSAVHIQALVSADVILPVISSKLQLLFINLASVPGGQLVNSPTAAILGR
jgi:hypothetical protein